MPEKYQHLKNTPPKSLQQQQQQQQQFSPSPVAFPPLPPSNNVSPAYLPRIAASNTLPESLADMATQCQDMEMSPKSPRSPILNKILRLTKKDHDDPTQFGGLPPPMSTGQKPSFFQKFFKGQDASPTSPSPDDPKGMRAVGKVDGLDDVFRHRNDLFRRSKGLFGRNSRTKDVSWGEREEEKKERERG
jgi:hypothetical protein